MSLQKFFVKEIKKEANMLCSKTNPSLLRNISSDNLAKFKFETLKSELQIHSPLTFGVLNEVVKGSATGVAVSAAVALHFRNMHMSSLHHIVSQILDHGGATDEVNKTINMIKHVYYMYKSKMCPPDILVFTHCKQLV